MSARTPAMPAMSPAAAVALETVTRHREKLETAQSGLSRTVAADALQQARAALPLRERALIDLWVLHDGKTLPEIATMTAIPRKEIDELVVSAASRLAEHYETTGAQERREA